jgi:predicted aspartyl protease
VITRISHGHVILSAAKDLGLRILRSFAVGACPERRRAQRGGVEWAAQDDGPTPCSPFRLICLPRWAWTLLVVGGCALYSDVSIQPLVITPASIDRGSDVQSMLSKADYLRAVDLARVVETRSRKSVAELAALGAAELASGRFDSARTHLRQAIDLEPFRSVYSTVAWDLSQTEYMLNNYDTSLEWAKLAVAHGLAVKPWHLEYLNALSSTETYRFTALSSDTMPMRIGRPDVPRIDVRVNDVTTISAVIDSGAVLSILSEKMATTINVDSMGDFRGEFYGLLGEPIAVRFGLLRSLELAGIRIENVPVAIMPDAKMRFLVTDKREFNIDFLLGANLLKEFRMELDFTRSTVTWTRVLAADRRPDPEQNLFIGGFRPFVRGTVNRKGWFLFILDTGSEVTFLNESRLATLPINYYTPRVHTATLQGLGGAKKRGTKIENVEIGIDKWAGTFTTVPMYSSEESQTVGILGQNFLKRFSRVVIDFGRMRVDLER